MKSVCQAEEKKIDKDIEKACEFTIKVIEEILKQDLEEIKMKVG